MSEQPRRNEGGVGGREFVSKFYRQSVDSLTGNYETPFPAVFHRVISIRLLLPLPPTTLSPSWTLDRPFSTYLTHPLSRESLPSTPAILSAIPMYSSCHSAASIRNDQVKNPIPLAMYLQNRRRRLNITNRPAIHSFSSQRRLV